MRVCLLLIGWFLSSTHNCEECLLVFCTLSAGLHWMWEVSHGTLWSWCWSGSESGYCSLASILTTTYHIGHHRDFVSEYMIVTSIGIIRHQCLMAHVRLPPWLPQDYVRRCWNVERTQHSISPGVTHFSSVLRIITTLNDICSHL